LVETLCAQATDVIAIVDDDPDVRGGLESLLRSSGVEVCGFPSAEAYLAEAGRRHTDCLLTDLHLPGLNGLELQAALKALGSAIPVVVMTAFPTEAARAQAAGAGAAAFLVKPVDPEALLELLLGLVGASGSL
jgi:FixJ family two-component response regulator